jgi:hypothetical protein
MVSLTGSKAGYRFILERFPAEAVSDEQRANARFILAHMHEIDIELAAKLNPLRVAQNPHNRFYLCDRYDGASRRCLAYDERPPMCQGAPLYGFDPASREVVGALTPFPQCSFWQAVPRAQWPAHVTEETVWPSPDGALTAEQPPRSIV